MKPVLPVDFDWLVGLLNDKCHASGSLVKANGYEFKEIGDTKGHLSRVYRVTIQWESNGTTLPCSIILKIPTEDKIKTLDASLANDMFEDNTLVEAHNRECRCYQYLALAPQPPIPVPKCYFIQERVKNGDNGLLVLEDLADGRSMTYGENASLKQFLEFAGHIASVQAYGLNHKDATKLIQPTKQNIMLSMMNQLETGLDAMMLDIGDRFPWSKDEFMKLANERKTGIALTGDPTTTGHTPVVSLGDPQPNNMFWYIDPENSDKVTSKVRAFIDFQLAHIGYCMMDFACPLLFWLPTEVRRESLDTIVDHYLKVLGQKIKGGVCPIEKEEAMFCAND